MSPNKPKSASASAPGAGRNLQDLIRWLEKEPARLLDEFPQLSYEEQFSLILLASGQLRQELLLTSPHAAKLVARLPAQEVFITLKEIGIADAVPLLSLMTAGQLQFLNDMETWDKDDFSPTRFLSLLEVMGQCGEDRISQWLTTVDPESLVLFILFNGTVSKPDVFAEPGEESDLPPFISIDGYYRYFFSSENTRPHLETVLRILHSNHEHLYQMVLESAIQDMFSEIQEEALRFREVRLSDHGIPIFEDAVQVYRPLAQEEFLRLLESAPRDRPLEGASPVIYPVRWLPPQSFLRSALRLISGHPEADSVRMELAALGNKIVVADGLEPDNPHLMKAALQKVAGCLTIALEHLAGTDTEKAADWILKSRLTFLFRLGYGKIDDLSRKARSLRDRCQFRWADHYVSLAGTPFDETLWALSLPRPLFFEGGTEGGLFGFRDFGCIDDVHVDGARLTAIRSLCDFFLNRNLSPSRIKALCIEGGWGDRLDEIQWSSVLHTMLGMKILAGSEEFRPLLPDEMTAFMDRVFLQDKGSPTRRLDPGYGASLEEWLLRETVIQDASARSILEQWIRDGTQRLDDELGGLPPGEAPDPRFIHCVCVRHPSNEG